VASNPTEIAVAVVEWEGRFLVGRRPPGVALGGLWEFPGGKIEPGETPEQAAVRECGEETGIVVRVVASYPEHTQQYDHGCVRLHFLACCPVESDAMPRLPFAWVERHQLKELEFPAGNAALVEKLCGMEGK
jgi:mutator protein MutT